MSRQTSLDVWEEIRDSLAPGLRKSIYSVMVANPEVTDWTAGELVHWFATRKGLTANHGHSITPRIAEMVAQGLLVETGTRRCSVTQNECITVAISGKPGRVVDSTYDTCLLCGHKTRVFMPRWKDLI